MSEKFSALQITKRLLKQPGEWYEFHVQERGTEGDRTGDKFARNKANMYRIYVKRHGYPIEIQALRQDDGLIHCWGRWNEGDQSSNPHQGSTGP